MGLGVPILKHFRVYTGQLGTHSKISVDMITKV